jgi:hypothetical protein
MVRGATARPGRDQEFQTMADMAIAVPPEFGADVLIRLAESTKAPDRTTKIDLLRKAFYLAPAAEQPVKRGTLVFSPDTRAGFLALAFRMLNLDTLSLQSRVVGDMLHLDTVKARAMLEEIKLPALSPVGCAEPLTYDVALFYRTVGQVAREGFAAKDKSEGRKIALLAPYVGSLQSHAQVRPAAQLLLSADLSPADLGQLANMFAIALSHLRGDERSFASMNMDSDEYTAPGAIASLITALNAKRIPNVALISALRQYLVSNFSGEVCGEAANTPGSLPEVVKYFNREFQLALQSAQIAPITEEELRGVHVGEKLTDVSFWQSPEAKKILHDEQRLKFGGGETQLTIQERTTPAWSSQLTDFLAELAAWKSDRESVADFFDEKSSAYPNLINLVPNGAERSRAIDAFVEFLEQNSAQAESRIEWMVMADHVLSGARAADDRQEVILAFVNSRDSTLSLYGRLERWQPRDASPPSKPSTGNN